MKIRNRHLLRAAGWLGSRAARMVINSLDLKIHYLGNTISPHELPTGYAERLIYCVWHENVVLPVVKFGRNDFAVLISKHADAQILGTLIESTGMSLVQGSTTRGGIEAVRKLIAEDYARQHLAITPDGPRGPRRVVQPGIVYIASRAGMKIACVGIGFHRPRRAKSWDKMAIPRLWSRARIVCGDLLSVPPDLRSDGIEQYRQIVQAEMDRLNTLAENWAETGELVLPPAPTLTVEETRPRLAS